MEGEKEASKRGGRGEGRETKQETDTDGKKIGNIFRDTKPLITSGEVSNYHNKTQY